MRFPMWPTLEVQPLAPRISGDLYFSKPIQKYLKNSYINFHSKISIALKVTELFPQKNQFETTVHSSLQDFNIHFRIKRLCNFFYISQYLLKSANICLSIFKSAHNIYLPDCPNTEKPHFKFPPRQIYDKKLISSNT